MQTPKTQLYAEILRQKGDDDEAMLLDRPLAASDVANEAEGRSFFKPNDFRWAETLQGADSPTGRPKIYINDAKFGAEGSENYRDKMVLLESLHLLRDGGVVPEIEKRLVDGPESKEIWQMLGQKGGGNVPDSFTSDLDADRYKKGIEESILSGDKAWATITHIADTSPDPELATLARKLAPHVLDVTTNMRNSGDIFNLAGRFTPSERHIKLFDPQLRLKYDNISSGVSEGTAIHEALHAALRTKEATLNSDAWAEVEQVYKELQRRYRGMKTSSKDDIVAKSKTSSRTLYDSPEHMLINALTDKETQEFLKQVPGRESERRAQMLGGSSLWDGILNYVIKALDLDYTDVTALDSVLTVSKKVLDELDSQVPRPMRKPSQVK